MAAIMTVSKEGSYRAEKVPEVALSWGHLFSASGPYDCPRSTPVCCMTR